MNKLPTAKRTQILSMLIEEMSMPSITRITGVSINTVAKLLNDAGHACAAYHHEQVRGIRGHRRIECDEIWALVYAKERAVPHATAAPDGAGDAWTFTAIDADAKLILSYLVSGERDGQTALAFMDDIRSRLENRPQLSTNGLVVYQEAVEGAFGGDVDFAQVIKQYGKESGEDNECRHSPPVCTDIEKRRIEGQPGHVQGEHVIRRAPQPLDAHGDAPLHSAHQYVQQARREALGDGESLHGALQLLPHSQDAAGHTGDGGWPDERASGHGMDRRPHRRAGTETEQTEELPEAKFKLRHYLRK